MINFGPREPLLVNGFDRFDSAHGTVPLTNHTKAAAAPFDIAIALEFAPAMAYHSWWL